MEDLTEEDKVLYNQIVKMADKTLEENFYSAWHRRHSKTAAYFRSYKTNSNPLWKPYNSSERLWMFSQMHPPASCVQYGVMLEQFSILLNSVASTWKMLSAHLPRLNAYSLDFERMSTSSWNTSHFCLRCPMPISTLSIFVQMRRKCFSEPRKHQVREMTRLPTCATRCHQTLR